MLTLEELKKLHDKAYKSGQVTRERAADDMVFYFVTQWDDAILSETQLAYRGEFNILKKAGRDILANLDENPVQVDFEPINETRDDAAELADGLYRKDSKHNASIEAQENAKQEAVVCGYGAWEICTKYETNRSGDRSQVIRRKPIFEANNNVFWDPNAKFVDKSDAKYVSCLRAYSEDGYKDLVKELTGEELEKIIPESFKTPEHSYAFPWIAGEGKKIYVTKFYYKEKIKDKILTFTDPFGETIDLRESSLKEVMDDMISQGYSIEAEKKIERYQITLYVASGAEVLHTCVIPGDHIPVVPCYGEHAYIEGEEHYEGVTRLAKDPQRLRNFQLSYLADISSQSPRTQPIFFPEQIAGFEKMYDISGIDNRYPYLLQNRKSATGEDLPMGPVAQMPDQPIPQALAASIQLSREAVEDVANPGIPQDIADPDMSGKAIHALQAKIDKQAMVYQKHYKHAIRRDAEVYASMAAEVYDAPKKVMVELPNGTKKTVEIMKTIIDKETGDVIHLNDLRNAEFEIYSKIGPSYTSKREQTVERLSLMISQLDPNDPVRKALQLKQLMLMDGVDFDDIREYANKQLVLSGIKQPETPEEQQLYEQAMNAPKEPDPAMVLAKAEELKGQADIMQEKREGIKMQLEDENTKTKHQIDMFNAETNRIKVQIEAQKAGASIQKAGVDIQGKQLENQGKILEMIKPEEPEMNYQDMSDEELFQQLAG